VTEVESEKQGVFGLGHNANIGNNNELLAWKFFMFFTCEKIKDSKRKILNLRQSFILIILSELSENAAEDASNASADELRRGQELASGW